MGYPKYLVEKIGYSRIQQILNPVPTDNNRKPSRKKSVEEKVENYVARVRRFSISMCSRCCNEKMELVLAVLATMPNVEIAPDGTCTKKSGRNRSK